MRDAGRRPIVIDPPVVVGSRLEARIRPGGARRYIRRPSLWFDYGAGLDLSALPPAQRVIPFLGALLPVAVATGVPLQVPPVDAEFARACDEVAGLLGRQYRSFGSEGFGLAGRRVDVSRSGPADGAVLLFSGGVDSTSSLIDHRREVRDLVLVWGADIPLGDDDLWARHLDRLSRSPLVGDRARVVARTNVGEALDFLRLTHRFGRDFPGHTWWGAVQHGITLTATAAPVAVIRRRDRCYIASSHTAADAMPWGSTPALDDRVRWGGGRVVHDQFDLTRQMKLARHISPFVAGGGAVRLAVCFEPYREFVGLNCGWCEKCLRTAVGLAATGTDPAAVGVPVHREALDRARGALETGAWHRTPPERFRWSMIQDDLRRTGPPPLWGPGRAKMGPDLRAFLDWFGTADIILGPSTRTRSERARAEAAFVGELAGRSLPGPLRRAIRRRLMPVPVRSDEGAEPGRRRPAGRPMSSTGAPT